MKKFNNKNHNWKIRRIVYRGLKIKSQILFNEFYNTRPFFNILLFFLYFQQNRSLFRRMVCRILITSVHSLVSIIPLSRKLETDEWSTVEPQETANALSTMDQSLTRRNLFLLQWIRALLTSITSHANAMTSLHRL